MKPSSVRGSSRTASGRSRSGSTAAASLRATVRADRMLGYLKRLATTGAAYQGADIVSRVFALVTLPLYLHHVSSADYGIAEVVVTWVVLLSIPLRLGLGEAIVRFWFLDEDPEKRRRLARTTTAATFWVSTLGCLALLPFAGSLSQALLNERDAV